MDALIFIEQRSKDDPQTSIIEEWLVDLGCDKTKFFRLDKVIADTQTSIHARVYSGAMRLRLACKEAEDNPCVVIGYPTLVSAWREEECGWGTLHSYLMRWSSARYKPCVVHPGFISDGGTIDQLHDMVIQNLEIRREAAGAINRGLTYKIANLAGGDDPTVVLVGDQHNHPKGAIWPQPFLGVMNSSLLLHTSLTGVYRWSASGWGSYPWCFNAHDKDAPEVFEWLTTSGKRRYIALGDNASKWLGDFPHVKVPHPSWVNRFKKMSSDEYGLTLVKAVGEAPWA